MSLLTLQMPALPDPVKVVLQPATTALLVFDMIDRICQSQPNCTGVMVPALASLLARARKAGVFVLYSTREPESSKWMPEVAPAPGDPIVKSYWSGPILQHRSRQNAEGKGDYDADSHRLEGQRLGGLYIGRSNAAGVHCGCAHRCQLSRNGLRSGDRPIPNTESE